MANIIAEKNSVKNQGWLVTIAGTFALLALGVLYSWSVFKANIPVEWGWVEAQKTLPYSVACVVFSIMTFVGARLLARYSPRLIVSAGGANDRSLVAYDRNSGQPVWGGGSDAAASRARRHRAPHAGRRAGRCLRRTGDRVAGDPRQTDDPLCLRGDR